MTFLHKLIKDKVKIKFTEEQINEYAAQVGNILIEEIVSREGKLPDENDFNKFLTVESAGEQLRFQWKDTSLLVIGAQNEDISGEMINDKS